ncbi:MAG: Hpt domain-containing protein [Candidatus Competibacteraceae bacterium]
MISRVVDHSLAPLKDDLDLALQQLRFVLELHNEQQVDPVVLECTADTLEQLRSALVALDHREAADLLEETRFVAQALTQDELAPPQTAWPTLHRAIARLADYLSELLEKGHRPALDLAAVTDELRAIRRLMTPAEVLPESAAQAVFSEATAHSALAHELLEQLKRLQAVAADLSRSGAPEPWARLQHGLQEMGSLLTAVNWTDAAVLLSRLEHLSAMFTADTAAPAHDIPQISGGVAEILATLEHYLKPLSIGQQPSAIILEAAEEHLEQLENLLGRFAIPAATPEDSAQKAAVGAEMLELPELDLFSSAEAPVTPPLPALKPTDTSGLEMDDLEWRGLLDFDAVLSPPGMAQNSDQDALEWSPQDGRPATAALPVDTDFVMDQAAKATSDHAAEPALEPSLSTLELANLLGIAEADPEFVEVFFEEARGELTTIREQLVAWHANLQDKHVLSTLRRSFHTLKGSGRMVGATVIGDFAWNFENLLNRILDGQLAATPAIMAAVEAAEIALQPLVGAIPPRSGDSENLAALAAHAVALLTPTEAPAILAELSTKPIPAVAEIDPEFIEVFFEEARGELTTIRDCLAIWQANLNDRQPLVTIRRAFHTLKGSGRMVGQTTIGEFAWCFENLLNRVLEGALAVVPTLATAIGDAIDALQPLVGAAPRQGDETAVLARLTAQAEDLLQGPPPTVAIPALAEPEVGTPSVTTPPVPVEPVAPAELLPAALAAPAVDLELVQVFQYEATEILDASDTVLRRLSTEPANLALPNDLRRGMHTLKGSSRMAGLIVIGDLAHAAESVLDALGKGASPATQPILDSLQHVVDRLNRMLAEISGGASPAAAGDLIEDLHAMADLIMRGEPVVEVWPLPPAAPIEPVVAAAPEPRSIRP